MGSKVRHIVRFEHTDADVFDGVDGDILTEAIQEALPEEIEIGKCYCEYPKPYGHRPYVSVVTIEQKLMVDDYEKRSDDIRAGVVEGVTNVVEGEEIYEQISEGWM